MKMGYPKFDSKLQFFLHPYNLSLKFFSNSPIIGYLSPQTAEKKLHFWILKFYFCVCHEFFLSLHDKAVTMDTKTLIEQISAETSLGKKEVAGLLDSFIEIIGDRCGEMDTVTLPGFGSFEPKKRMERVMVMPGTGKRMLLPPKLVLSFKPSAMLKQKLRESSK